MLLTEDLPERMSATFTGVQHDLFDLGGELSVPGHAVVNEGHVARLERELDALNATLPALKDFVLPGGSRAAASAHVARTVCRRAERRLVALTRTETVPPLLAAVPQPPVRSAVRRGTRAQPPRRARGRVVAARQEP